MGGKFVFGKIALDAKTFFAVLVENQDRRRPEDFKAVEGRRRLLDVESCGNEVFLDVFRQLRIAVRLGFQPNASASSGRGAEVEEHGPMILFCLAESSLSIFYPVDHHEHLHVSSFST